ncbi:MAG: plasmid mobilization relaxosome protein MobC [Alphaproteobacteria bacterium]|nr:plasmid mobilization relaxosome protein MobC [Alphaproteobacteria bacterium]
MTVRLSDTERDIIKTKAATMGVRLNAYIRAAALGSDYTPPRDPELLALLRLTLRELLHEGNNLNQLAKEKNSGKIAPSQIIVRLDAIRGPLVRTLRTVRTALARRMPQP